MKANKILLRKSALATIDVLLFHAGLVLAFFVRFGSGLSSKQHNLETYLDVIPWLAIATVAVFSALDLYTDWYRRSGIQLLSLIVWAVLILTVLTMAITFWERGFAFPRSVMLLAVPIQTVLLTTYRGYAKRVYQARFSNRRLLIIAEDEEACLRLADRFLNQSHPWLRLKELLPLSEIDLLPVRLPHVDAVALSSKLPNRDEIVQLSVQQGREVLLVPEFPDLLMLRASPQQVDDLLVLSIRPATPGPVSLLIKRMLDLAGAALILLITSPIMALLYVLIPLTSKGPALFQQERLGLAGKPYQLFKFRTMVADAEKGTGPILAAHNDPRVTRLGHFLRATRLDELPQLINVLRGDMSLVGPRPERAFFVDQFRSSLPTYHLRLAVKPGITGLAQIMGKYSTGVEDKLRYDLMYLQEYSILLDLKILVLTACVLLEPQKAAGLRTAPQWFVPSRTRHGRQLPSAVSAAAHPPVVPERPAQSAA